MLRRFDRLPRRMQNPAVKHYYDILAKKQASLVFKRLFDIAMSMTLILLLFPVMGIIALLIRLDSPGPVLFRQTRVTQYGRQFKICKFRTMVDKAESLGSQVTVKDDARVTRVGKKLRGCRLDELPQLFNVLAGDMTFVGTRPEVVRYVRAYTDEMTATLLLPAGITSEASILYKDEERLMTGADDADRVYIEKVLPEKMVYNLKSLETFNFMSDIRTMIRTVLAVIR